jgi:hypothetical protein
MIFTRIKNGADAKQSMDQRALELAGVEFTNGDQPGVRPPRPLRRNQGKPSADRSLPKKQVEAKHQIRPRRTNRASLHLILD